MNSADRVPSGIRDIVLAHGTPDSTDVPLFTGKDPSAPRVKHEIEQLRKEAGERIGKILDSGGKITWQDVSRPLPPGMGISTDL